MMILLEGIRIALWVLWNNKLRSALTLLGNVVSVMSLVAVVSVIDGVNTYVKEEIADKGTGVYEISRVNPLEILTDPDRFLESLKNPNLTLDDVEYLRAHLRLARAVDAKAQTQATLKAGTRSLDAVGVEGRDAVYNEIQALDLAAGRHFVPFEVQQRRAVCVIGRRVREQLFPERDPIGRTLDVGGHRFTVVGLAAERGTVLGQDLDLFVMIPVTTFQKIFGSRRSLSILVAASDLNDLELAREEGVVAMRIRHGLRPTQENNFAVTTSEGLLGLWSSISRGIFLVLTLVVAISSVVAGIVIMNIMLMAVSERTREIGVRKAIGARRSHILWQFLIEAVTLSVIGGVLGIAGGFVLAEAVRSFSPMPATVQPWSIGLGLGVTGVVGLFFGLVPASRAANLDPIEALRHE
jgi:putative ABC transport system permease protein